MQKKKRPSARSAPIQFRATGEFQALIETYSRTWRTSVHETCRRLAALAAFELDARDAQLVVEYAQRLSMDVPDFVGACSRLYVELQSINLGRCQAGQSPLTEQERKEQIELVVRQYALWHRDPERPEEERLKIRRLT